MSKVVKKIEYVLKKSLRKRGEVGDIICVRPGFGRYLEKEQFAQRATADLMKDLEQKRLDWREKEKDFKSAAQILIDKVKNIDSIVIKKRTTQGDKLYDSIRPENIQAAIKEKGIILNLNDIKINNQIKRLGKHKVIIHAYGNLETELDIDVISDQEII